MFSKNERWNIYIYIKKYSCQWSAGIYYTNATSQIDFWLLGLDYVATTSVSGGTRKLCVQNQDCVLHCIWKKDCTISKLQTVMSLRSSELQGVSPNLASFAGIPQPRGFPRKGGFGEKRLVSLAGHCISPDTMSIWRTLNLTAALLWAEPSESFKPLWAWRIYSVANP